MDSTAISFQKVSYVYNPGTAFEFKALNSISTKIKRDGFTAIIGHTGSGKSTLMKIADGLMQPTSGRVQVGDVQVTATSSKEELARLRSNVGFVFQFPESQLFADTVIEDVMFGPHNLGNDDQTARLKAAQALDRLHMDKSFYEKSPFELSGGQMRRVAIAGVIAMDPETLILDEPTAGLDPQGRLELMELIKELNNSGVTIVLITHQMEQVAEYADHVLVLNKGKLTFDGSPRELFNRTELLNKCGLTVPETVRFQQLLMKDGFNVNESPLTLEELVTTIKQNIGEKRTKDE